MSDLKYRVAFTRIPGIGTVRFAQLESFFGNLEKAWNASPSDLKQAGLDSRSINSILESRTGISPEGEMEKLWRHGVKAVSLNDPAYPTRLKEIHDAPPVIYIRGDLAPADEWAISVVGTRRATVYGREVTRRLVEDLCRNRITIVSGLARGIDSEAHQAALKSEGRTIAVLACGLDLVYPAENVKLAQAIIDNGALVSEYPLGTKPKAENFPRRNRIMAGMSLGVVVAEAGERSGALLTADLALEQNREVFAIPGSILSPASRGTNRLIQDGAKLVREAEDILEELNLTMIPRQIEMREVLPGNDIESLLMSYLSHEPVHIDEVCRSSKLPVATVSSTLAMMELKGMVRQTGGMNYTLAYARQP